MAPNSNYSYDNRVRGIEVRCSCNTYLDVIGIHDDFYSEKNIVIVEPHSCNSEASKELIKENNRLKKELLKWTMAVQSIEFLKDQGLFIGGPTC